MPYLIGTAGHVDHGKTTLIAALTGIDADRLPEEKARGMTIDIGFAYLDLPSGRASIVDVPGHERLIKNMLTGAAGVDVALLCVAADEGLKPQTLEHLEILRLLQARSLVVALTKCDAADEGRILEVENQVADLVKTAGFDAHVVRVSAVTGAGLDELRSALDNAVRGLGPREDSGGWYLPIDRVFTIAGHGTIVTGTLARGSVSPGAAAVVIPGGDAVRLRSVQVHAESVGQAEAGQRVALNVAGVRRETLHRGQMVCAPGVGVETSCADARLTSDAEIGPNERLRVHLGSGEFLARASWLKSQPGILRLRFEEVVACVKGQRLLLRRYSPPEVLAGGIVVVPVAKGGGVVVDESAPLADRIVRVVESASRGATVDEVCRALGLTPQELGDSFEELRSDNRLFGFAGFWMTPEQYASCSVDVLAELQRLHEANPQASGVPKSAVFAGVRFGQPAKVFDRLIAHMAERGVLVQSGNLVRAADFQIRINDKQAALLGRVVDEMRKHGALRPTADDVARALSVPRQAIEEMFRLGQETGQLVDVGEGLLYPRETLEELKNIVRGLGERFTVAQFRDATGSSRKFALPILQFFDESRFTKRVGDERAVIG